MTIAATLLSGVLPGRRLLWPPPRCTRTHRNWSPLPEEEPLIAKSVAKRRNEFITVRYCARQALGELGVAPVPILKGEKGEPCWPDGVVGSLTHCEGFRGAAVGRHEAVRSVGIDAEPHDVLPKGVLDAISLPDERVELQALPAGLHWDRILFCAKEATYKAWFPLTRRWLGFEDAHITFDVDERRRVGRVRIADSHRSCGGVRTTARDAVGPLVGARRPDADGDRPVTGSWPCRRRQAGGHDESRRRGPLPSHLRHAKGRARGHARSDGHRRARRRRRAGHQDPGLADRDRQVLCRHHPPRPDHVHRGRRR